MRIEVIDRNEKANEFIDEWYVAYEGAEAIGTTRIEYNEEYTLLTDFWIKPTHRNKGYGDILLKEILSRIKEPIEDEVWLTVLKTNEPAIKLYLKNGFEIKFDHEDNNHQWMCLNLKNN
jgi:ribosomal protein S18 acetylase RimI-like enzyme